MGIDPLTLGLVMSTVSAGVGAISQMQASAYQQAVAERNAVIAENNARMAVENSQQEQQDWSEGAREQFGGMIAELASGGVMVEGGSAGLLRSGSRKLIGRDAERIREEGDIKAKGFRQQGADFSAEAGQAGRRRTFDLFGGVANTFGTYLSGATQNRKTRALLETR